jgi:TM2 domain-containing membrane protein YozV
LDYIDPIYTAGMTEYQRNWFYAEYQQARREEVVGVLLAVFLGNFGVHHFYLGRTGFGVLYLLFFWTGIPAILGFIEAFFMPGRVRAYNAMQAGYIAAQIRALVINGYPPLVSVCPACGAALTAGAGFCPRCGAAVAAPSVA